MLKSTYLVGRRCLLFKCDKCGTVSQSGEKQETVTVETREKSYYNIYLRQGRNELHLTEKDDKQLEDLQEDGWQIKKTQETYGKEIIKEVALCQNCYKGQV